jgi:hypothetical protein
MSAGSRLGRESETEDVLSSEEIAAIEAELEQLDDDEGEEEVEEGDEAAQHAELAQHYARLAQQHQQLAEASPSGTGATAAYSPFGSGATTTADLEDAPSDELDKQGDLQGGGVGRGTVGQLQGNKLVPPPASNLREGGYVDRRAPIAELVETGDVDGLEQLITEMAGEMADQVIEETLEAGLAAARDEFERQLQEHDERHRVDLERVQQAYKAAAIIDADPELPTGAKQSLKESFFDRHFVGRKDGETDLSADDVLREAVGDAIKAKKGDLQEFKEARVTGMGATTSAGADSAAGGRRARRGRGGADRRLDEELQIPDHTTKAKEQ